MASYPALDLRFAAGPGAGTLQDMLYAELDAFEPVAIHEHESGDGWRVFFRTSAQREAARRALAAEFENAVESQAVDVDDEDWARRSQESLKAARAGRIVVAPPWDVPRGANDVVVVIDPSTGFGTGHHPTTRFCLEILQDVVPAGKRVIDVGTGSGVLAIAASKLGAREVIAIDHDPDALRNARDNVQRNDVRVDVVEADLTAVSLSAGDVVLANLTAAVLVRFADALKALVASDGLLIASGFGPGDLPAVADALGGGVSKRLEEGDWAAAAITFPAVTSREESR